MYYRLVFSKSTKQRNFLKITLLIAGLLCDIVAIIGILMALCGMPKYLFFLLSLIFSVFFRVVALRLVYSIESKLQDNYLIISKIYPNKSKVVFKEKLGDFAVMPYNGESIDELLKINCDNILKNDNIDENIQNKEVAGKNQINTLCEKENEFDYNLNNGNDLAKSKNCTQSNVINLIAANYEKYLVICKNVKILCNLDKYIYAVALKGEEI